jgi:hypothetical protein
MCGTLGKTWFGEPLASPQSTASSLYHGFVMKTAKADVVDLMISNNIGCHFSHLTG